VPVLNLTVVDASMCVTFVSWHLSWQQLDICVLACRLSAAAVIDCVNNQQDIPVGMPVHNVELVPGKGGQICRSAGCMATIVNKQTEHAIVRLPSGVCERGLLGRIAGGGATVGRVVRIGRAVCRLCPCSEP
jgi:ribosomal protein L2